MAAHPDAEWYAVNGVSGDVLSSEEEIMPDSEPEADGLVVPLLIDTPAAWTACFVQHDENFPLRTYRWYTESGPKVITLPCGYATSSGGGFGWHHIALEHEQQWRQRIIQVGQSTDGAGWDDLMAWQIQGAMDFPAKNVDQVNGKRCIGAPTVMYDSSGEYAYTFYPTTVFTEDSKIVITSIPGSTYTC